MISSIVLIVLTVALLVNFKHYNVGIDGKDGQWKTNNSKRAHSVLGALWVFAFVIDLILLIVYV